MQKSFKMEAREQKIQLVKGEFTPDQASDVIVALINEKIKYHKKESMQLWENNHNSDQEPINKRIKELEEEKKVVLKFISKMRDDGKNLNVNGVLEMMSV